MLHRNIRKQLQRRAFLHAATGTLAGAFWADDTLSALPQNTNTNSRPSALKITDLRVAVVAHAPMPCPIIRIDTNQGIYGLGEQRGNSTPTEALRLKSRILGENPCNVEKIFRKIRQFANNGRNGGGVSGIEMALWDLAGKAYGVPVFQMLGGKYRDRIRCYADTTTEKDPKAFARKLKNRMDLGFTWLKMDLGIPDLEGILGAYTHPLGQTNQDVHDTQHMFTGMEFTKKGIQILADYVAQVREVIGMEVPLSIDHVGHIGVNSCIRFGRALEDYNIAWLEDLIPWQHTMLLKEITDSIEVPTLTGEDIYLADGFLDLARNHAVDIVHPDLAGAGGILETKRIGDLCQSYGLPMAMHFAGTPVSAMANAHCAAATEGFLVLEHHSVDVPWWNDLAEGVEKPIVKKGFITVPEKPGLGVTLNEDAVRQHLLPGGPGFFQPTPQWDHEKATDRLWG
jgi:L-alanine-DL-glutamate epimerase-like enolase superfamily enzyme